MQTFYVRPVPLLTIEMDKSAFTYRQNIGQTMKAPLYAWYIGGGDKHILVDTAADEYMASQVRGFKTGDVVSFEDALGKLDLVPR